MAAVRAVVLCVAGAMVCALLRVQKPEFRPMVGIAVALAALGLILPELSEAADTLKMLFAQTQPGEGELEVLLRATGIAMIAEAGAQLCKDADEQALAGRIYLAGRVVLLGMSVPLLIGLGQELTGMMGR